MLAHKSIINIFTCVRISTEIGKKTPSSTNHRRHHKSIFYKINLLVNSMDDPTLDRGILIADDQTYLLDLVRSAFSDLTYNLFFARNGRDALTLLDTNTNIELLVLDHVMDYATGLEVLKRVRTGKTAAPANLPALLVTGYGDTEVVQLARALDVSSVLTKPVSLAKISDRLRHAISHPITAKGQDVYEAIVVSPPHAAHSSARRSPGVVLRTNDAPLWRRRTSASKKPIGNVKRGRTVWCKLENLCAGMVIAQDVRGNSGLLIVADGVELTSRIIDRLNEQSQTTADLAFLKMYATPAGHKNESE